MKKQYMKPSLEAVKIRHSQMLCASGPDTHDEVSTNPSYVRQYNGCSDDETGVKSSSFWSEEW